MIYTCTMNPAIDLFINTEDYLPEIVNRTNDDEAQPNGKGVNVSFILKSQDILSTAIGFSGGFTGDFITKSLQRVGIQTNFVPVKGNTRINVFTHVEKQNTEYKLVNQGPLVNEDAQKTLLDMIEKIQPNDILCVSGSLPKGVAENILVKISQIAQEKKFRLILDSSYQSILDCLPYKPYLLKPNDEELAAWFGKTILTEAEAIYYGQQLIEKGAQKVLLSLGKAGAIYIDHNHILKGNAPNGKVINTACAGDTLLATFISGIEKNKTLTENLAFSIAAGSSTAFSKGITDFQDVPALTKQIKITTIKQRSDKHDII